MITIEDRREIAAPIDRCFDLARSVEVHLAGNIHWGEQAVSSGFVQNRGTLRGSFDKVPPQDAPAVSPHSLECRLMELGDRVTFRARHFAVWQELTSQITRYERPTYFQDAMVKGIFRFLRHDHYFRSLAPGRTEMRDVFTFAAPLPVLGRIAEAAFLGRYMRNLLRERNAVIQAVAESNEWRRYLS